MKTLFLILVLSFAAFGQTVKPKAVLETNQPTKAEEFTAQESDILLQLLTAELVAGNCSIDETKPECRLNADKIADLYAQISRSPKLIRYLAAKAINEYEGSKHLVKSAPQASQIADEQNAELLKIIVAQNQRIIELLEKLAKGIK